MRYNYRNALGQFAVAPAVQPLTIVAGRLYEYRGMVVRARQKCANGKRHVSFHKQLHGFVEDKELRFIDRKRVQDYLSNAVAT